jgi:SAM-dependent methyltransferase
MASSHESLRRHLFKHPSLVYALKRTRFLYRSPLRILKRVSQRSDIRRYMTTHPCVKIILGCGLHRRENWLETDVTIYNKSTVYLDVTKRFPLEPDTVDYIFMEHVIEHIHYNSAKLMCSEILRVLKPGGRVRIATPNMNIISTILEHPLSLEASKYVTLANESCAARHPARNPSPAPFRNRPAFVVNRMFYEWGHRFVYDRETLSDLLEIVGFANIQFHPVGESSDPNLRNLEFHGTQIGDFKNSYETMVIEAEKANSTAQ